MDFKVNITEYGDKTTVIDNIVLPNGQIIKNKTKAEAIAKRKLGWKVMRSRHNWWLTGERVR